MATFSFNFGSGTSSPGASAGGISNCPKCDCCGSCDPTANMGIGLLNDPDVQFKRSFRWMLKIPGIVGQDEGGVRALPPRKGGRPALSFKEVEVQHLSETVYYPMKPEWKQLQLVLFDLWCNENPVFEWIKMIYTPQGSCATTGGTCASSDVRLWNPSVMGAQTRLNTPFKKRGVLELYNACGKALEKWILENCYPQTVDWGNLDMDSQDIVTCEISLRFDRAYMVQV